MAGLSCRLLLAVLCVCTPPCCHYSVWHLRDYIRIALDCQSQAVALAGVWWLPLALLWQLIGCRRRLFRVDGSGLPLTRGHFFSHQEHKMHVSVDITAVRFKTFSDFRHSDILATSELCCNSYYNSATACMLCHDVYNAALDSRR